MRLGWLTSNNVDAKYLELIDEIHSEVRSKTRETH